MIILATFLSNWLAEIMGIMTEKLVMILVGKCRTPCGSKATSEASWFLGLSLRIPLRALIFICWGGSGLCDVMVTRSEELYRVCVCVCARARACVCDLETSRIWQLGPIWTVASQKEKKKFFTWVSILLILYSVDPRTQFNWGPKIFTQSLFCYVHKNKEWFSVL